MDPDKPKEHDHNKDISEIVGQHGPWQLRIFVIKFVISFSCSWHNLALIFQSPDVQHWCTQTYNVTGLENNKQYQCYVGDQKCSSWVYDRNLNQNTIINEWDLVCDRKWLTSFAKSVYMFGHLVASLVFGQLSDRLGRRPVVLMCFGIFWISAFVTAFADSIRMFLLLRFLMALGQTAALTTIFVHLIEVMGSDVRSVYSILAKLGFVVGNIVLPVIASIAHDWRSLQFAITLPFLPMVVMYWFLYESPRWLLATGQVDKAKEILLEASKINGKTVDEMHLPLIKLCSRAPKEKDINAAKVRILDVLQYRNLRKSSFYLLYVWFCTSNVYYALAWSTNELEGDPYWNFFLSGLVEVPATLLCIFLDRCYGRRVPLANASILTGCNLIIYSYLINRENVEGKLFWFMLAKFCISISYSMLYIYSSEVFPTVIRGLGVGYCSGAARVGAMLSPFVSHLGGHDQQQLSYWIYGFLSISSGLCLFLLPETNNRKLPETLLEGELFFRNDAVNSNNHIFKV